MKNKFIISTFSLLFLVSCSSKADVQSSHLKCIDFVGKIERYKIKPSFTIIENKEYPSTEVLILTYQERKDFLIQLKNYLEPLKSTEKEGDSRYISSCQKLLNLSEDMNKSQVIKSEFENNVTNEFVKVLYNTYQKNSKNMVDIKACNGFGKHVSDLIFKYGDSDNEEHKQWIDKAIDKYEECKKSELKIIADKNNNDGNVTKKGDKK